uniref:Uncharacterized protein n=1 Tax=Setaria viridis TaxID=4556 RepID=A0A4U6V277_SETVI|nr:hypothetical protein SEVIR_4G115801v2 [Setaria viridis]
MLIPMQLFIPLFMMQLLTQLLSCTRLRNQLLIVA